MEDLSNKYKEKFDKLYCDNPNLSYVRYNSGTKKGTWYRGRLLREL